MSQLITVKSVTIDGIGKVPLAEKGTSFTPAAVKREHKAGRQAADGGWTETNTAAKLELALNTKGGLDIIALNAITDGVINVRLSDGTVHMMDKAYCSEPAGVNDGESKATFMSNESEVI